MYNCKQIKELILTDYVDAQLDAASKSQVENHLHQCIACQDFAKEVKSHLIVPFEKASRQEVPEYLWQEIQQKIQHEQYAKQGVLDSVRDWLAGLSFPRFMPALGSFVMLFFLGSSFFLNQQMKQAQDQEQRSYLTYMAVSIGSSIQVGSNDRTTPIEEYFL